MSTQQATFSPVGGSTEFQPAVPVGSESALLELAALWTKLASLNGDQGVVQSHIQVSASNNQSDAEREEARHTANATLFSGIGQLALGAMMVTGGMVEMRGLMTSGDSELDEQLKNANEFKNAIENPAREVELRDFASDESPSLKNHLQTLLDDSDNFKGAFTKEDQEAIGTASPTELSTLEKNVNEMIEGLNKDKTHTNDLRFKKHEIASKSLTGVGEMANSAASFGTATQQTDAGKEKAVATLASTSQSLAARMASQSQQRYNSYLGNLAGIFQALIELTNTQVSRN